MQGNVMQLLPLPLFSREEQGMKEVVYSLWHSWNQQQTGGSKFIRKNNIMKPLLFITAMIAFVGDVVVAETNSIRSHNLRQPYYHRLLQKDKKKDKIDWAALAEAIQANHTDEEIEATEEIEETEEIDWNAFAEAVSSAGETTVPPTSAPSTVKPTPNPTKTPTPEPTNTTLTPILPAPAITTEETSGSTPTAKPTEFNFLFSFGDNITTKVPLPLFRLEFVATTDNNRKLRKDELMTGDVEDTFIQIVTSQILSYLQENLTREVVSVDLNVEDKRENHFPQMIMFSYDLSGAVTFVGGEDEVPPLPTSNELLAEVLGILDTESFEEVLKSFDHYGLLSIDDVVVSIPNPSGTATQIQIADSSGVISGSFEEGNEGIATSAVVSLVTAFALTMAIIGYITVHKLRKYDENEDDESSFGPDINDDSFERVKTTYKNFRAKLNVVTPMGKNRQYDQFESPSSSVDSLFGAIEDSDSERPPTRNRDVEQQRSQPLSSTLESSFLPSHLTDNAFLHESDTASERDHQNQTLDLLYSDTDSYFGSSIATSILSSGVRPRISSKDYVYSDTDSSLRSELDYKEKAKNNPRSANMNDITRVSHLLLYNDDGSPSDSEITDAESAIHEGAVDNVNEVHPFTSDFSMTDDLFARLNELENKLAVTEGKFSQDNIAATNERLGDYKNTYNEAEDSSAAQKRNISGDIFTDESLGMIQRDRLRRTPPPSETEVDRDIIYGSKDSSLLGNMSDESDADDDELLFQGSISTIDVESEIGSQL